LKSFEHSPSESFASLAVSIAVKHLQKSTRFCKII